MSSTGEDKGGEGAAGVPGVTCPEIVVSVHYDESNILDTAGGVESVENVDYTRYEDTDEESRENEAEDPSMCGKFCNTLRELWENIKRFFGRICDCIREAVRKVFTVVVCGMIFTLTMVGSYIGNTIYVSVSVTWALVCETFRYIRDSVLGAADIQRANGKVGGILGIIVNWILVAISFVVHAIPFTWHTLNIIGRATGAIVVAPVQQAYNLILGLLTSPEKRDTLANRKFKTMTQKLEEYIDTLSEST